MEIKINEHRIIWKKCKYGHYENKHIVQKHESFELKSMPEVEIPFTHTSYRFFDHTRFGCKICDCKKFDSERKDGNSKE